MKKWFLVLLVAGYASIGMAKLKVVTTSTDLAWLVQQVGGSQVEVTSLLNGTENPHFVDAVPSFIGKVASADIVCSVGLDLEIGWLSKILSRSGNAKVQQGGNGFCEIGDGISVLDKPAGNIDRSMGDVHAKGNPHFWLSPDRMLQGAKVVHQILVANDEKNNTGIYTKNLKLLETKLMNLKSSLTEKLSEALKKAGHPTFMQYHKDFTYFFDAYGLKSAGSVEAKPGVVPSAGQIAKAALHAKKNGVKITLALNYDPKSTLGKFGELSGAKIIYLPSSIQKEGEPSDYIKFQQLYVDTIIEKLQ